MILKLDEKQKKRLTVELIIFIVLIVVALFLYPQTRDYIFSFWQKSKTGTGGLTKEQQQLQDKTIAGVVDEVSQDKVKLTTYLGSQGKKEWQVKITDKTVFQKKTPGNVPVEAKFDEVKKGDNIVATLTTKKTDKTLIAAKIEKIIVEVK